MITVLWYHGKKYSGTISKTFKIVPKKAAIAKLTSSKVRTIKIVWKKDSQADGYQIQYAGNVKFTKGKKNIQVKKRSTVLKKISKLKRKQQYYVRIWSYKKIGGKNCFGPWGKPAKVKCK